MSAATNAQHKWLDEIIREWIAKIDNAELLEQWEHAIKDRRTRLLHDRRMTEEQIVAGLRSCTKGTRLYCFAPGVLIRGTGGRSTTFAFYHYQPRRRVLWVAPISKMTRATATPLLLAQAVQVQIARTEVSVRNRAPTPTEGALTP